MKKELQIALIILAVAVAGFIISIFITEARNNSQLKNQFSIQEKEDAGGYVPVPAPDGLDYEYQKSNVTVWVIRILLNLLLPLFFLFSGLSSGMRSWLQARAGRVIVVVVLYFVYYSLIECLVNLPIDFYSGFVRKHSFGLSNQTFGKWILDYAKGFVLSTAAGALIVWIPFFLIKRFPGLWWLYLGLLTIPLFIFISYISPVYIDPLFSKYEALQDKELDAGIHEILQRTTIEDCKVFQVDKSVDTREMNAFMTGVFNTKRIVLWDTTVKNLTTRETLTIVAHEMGHFLMGHVWKSMVLSGLGCIFLFFLVDRAALWVIDRSGGVFGFTRLYDIAALPLLILVLNIFMLFAAPMSNAVSRYAEREADRFELELTRDNAAAAASIIKLHKGSLALPRPGIVYYLWNYDHPTFEDRVIFDNTYMPWEEGKPVRYMEFIKSE